MSKIRMSMSIENALMIFSGINNVTVNWSRRGNSDFFDVAAPFCLGHMAEIEFILRGEHSDRFVVASEIHRNHDRRVTISCLLGDGCDTKREVVFRFMNHHCAPNDEEQIMATIDTLQRLSQDRLNQTP